MLRIFWIVFILLQLFGRGSALGSEPPVEMRQERYWVTNEVVVQQQCGLPDRDIVACTRIRSTELDTRCVAEDSEWRIAAGARLDAPVFMTHKRYTVGKEPVIDHEKNHATDIREAVKAYLVRLETWRFPSRSSCEETARLEARWFQGKVAAWARESLAKRH